jgi:hypothetical protein
MEAAEKVMDKALKEKDISVVFCLDISGSMCVTEAVDGQFKLKGADKKQKEMKDLMKFGDGSD